MEFKQPFWFLFSVFLLSGIAIVFGEIKCVLRPVNYVVERTDKDASDSDVEGVNTANYTPSERMALCELAIEKLFTRLRDPELILVRGRTVPAVYELNEDQAVPEYVVAFICPTSGRSRYFWVVLKNDGDKIEIIYYK